MALARAKLCCLTHRCLYRKELKKEGERYRLGDRLCNPVVIIINVQYVLLSGYNKFLFPAWPLSFICWLVHSIDCIVTGGFA